VRQVSKAEQDQDADSDQEEDQEYFHDQSWRGIALVLSSDSICVHLWLISSSSH
jgi:hypothetical protein